jgi:hypothetical protein
MTILVHTPMAVLPVVDRTVPASSLDWHRSTRNNLSGLHIVAPVTGQPATSAPHVRHTLDTGLSFRARGVLSALLLLRPGTATGAEQLSNYGKEGREAIRRAMAELAAAGYLRRELRVPLSGRIGNGIAVSPVSLPGWHDNYPNLVTTYVRPDGCWSDEKASPEPHPEA